MSKETIKQRAYEQFLRLHERRMNLAKREFPKTRITVMARAIRTVFQNGLPVGWGA